MLIMLSEQRGQRHCFNESDMQVSEDQFERYLGTPQLVL